MGQQPIVDSQPDFAGGLNTVSAVTALRPDQVRQAQNIRLLTYGSATKRGGTQEMSASRPNGANIVSGGLYWSTQLKFLIVAGTNLYTGGVDIPVTWTSVASAAGHMLATPAMRMFTGVGGIDTVYIADGDAVGLKSYNSASTFTNGITTTPVVNGIEVYNSRLWGWFFGNSIGSNALFYSNLSTAVGSIGGDSLGVGASGGGQINVTTFGQAGIIVARVIGASLVIFHVKGISRLTGFGQSDITVQPQSVSADFSIVGRDAIAIFGGIGYAVSMQGLYRITEGGIAPVGTPEKPDPLPAALAAAYLNNTQATTCVFNVQTNEVWVEIRGVGVYAYHTILDAWSGPWTGPFATTGGGTMFTFPGDPLNNKLPYTVVTDDSGYILQADNATPTDHILSSGSPGTAFTTILQAHRMYGQSAFGQPSQRSFSKSWRWANVMATLNPSGAAPICVQASMLGTPSTTTFGSIVSAQQVYYQQGGGAYGPYVDVTITDTAATQSEYDSIEVQGFALGQR